MYTMLSQAKYLAVLLTTSPDYTKFTGPIQTILQMGLRILCTILVAITGIKLLLASIAMNTAVGDEKMQKKDDLTKAIKNFGITAAVVAAILAGGPLVMNWVSGYVDKATTSTITTS